VICLIFDPHREQREKKPKKKPKEIKKACNKKQKEVHYLTLFPIR
jgi:hypothetical protein